MSSNAKEKVFEAVLQQLQMFIKTNRLEPGDKLPSERELAMQLEAGRSSIREALRAMELLGLIETRRGEGTFLRAYRPYHTVELLSSFILNESQTKQELLAAKRIIEKEATKLAYCQLQRSAIADLTEVIKNAKLNQSQRHAAFFLIIFQYSENSLLQRIWQLMEDFTNTFHEVTYDEIFYEQLVSTITNNNYEQIEHLFDRIYS